MELVASSFAFRKICFAYRTVGPAFECRRHQAYPERSEGPEQQYFKIHFASCSGIEIRTARELLGHPSHNFLSHLRYDELLRKQKEGANVMIRKAALQIAAFGLLGLIVFNAYLAIRHSTQLQASAALSLETYGVQAKVDQIRQDFTDMETGQRGYLLTDDPSYLQPYTAAKESLGSHLASLRSALADRPESERSLEVQLESLAASKQAEIERTITLRQQGYRHRAFLLVQSNEGRDYMNRVRELASSLTSIESSRLAGLEKDRNANSRKAMSEIILANLALLVLTAGLFVLTRFHERRLELEAARNRQTLMLRDSELERLTSSLADQARASIEIIEENARLLLDRYAGFLPPQGYECAKQIGNAAAQVELLRRDLLGHPEINVGRNAA